ncbi:fumarylacetoacetate hydrolase family protein [Streptomyces heilongjiangensis]|uniref:Fumarylacetoacetate hydrolase family protein n=1 Tax=Streptomyces heilongjiangensis TaxID=945052 RepID=A0ABW1BKX5_9ACTN|nr:fumarylacetoacetate hydrolase family protein [Streptomyces heilongjiangensis]MDC2952221.1 fumarylacetoacetate hydrolase family protein [Streptomyces heilongjiangensis]
MLIARIAAGDHQMYARVDTAAGLVHLLSGTPFDEIRPTGESLPLAEVRLLAPAEPSKVLVAGRNYGDVVTPDLVVFMKPSTSVIGPDSPILLPAEAKEVRYEGELAVVIGRRCRDVSAVAADQAVFGYTCANDVTAWDIGEPSGHWTKAKSFDTFCPLGPWIRTNLDPSNLGLRTTVNGAVRQDGSTKQMIRDVRAVVSRCSALMTLLPGDVILTGTPAGAGVLRPGDDVTVQIDEIGSLANPVTGHQVRSVTTLA